MKLLLAVLLAVLLAERVVLDSLLCSASAFSGPVSLAPASAVRSSAVTMGPKKPANGLTEWLMGGRDGSLELLSGATRKEIVEKRFDIVYDTRPRGKAATKSASNAKSGTINPKDAKTW